jgi:hypothetical protein
VLGWLPDAQTQAKESHVANHFVLNAWVKYIPKCMVVSSKDFGGSAPFAWGCASVKLVQIP